MSQTWPQTIREKCFNVPVAMVVSIFIGQLIATFEPQIQHLIPSFSYQMNLGSNIGAVVLFTIASFIRGVCIRRFFNWFDCRGEKK